MGEWHMGRMENMLAIPDRPACLSTGRMCIIMAATALVLLLI
jgi:hypothetical protein